MSIDSAGSGRSRLLLQLFALVALLAAQQFLTVAGTGRLANGLQNSAHGPWFAVVTWLMLEFMSRYGHGWHTVLITVPACLCLAAATELLQVFTGGDPSWGDLVFDLIGATAALLVWCGRTQLLPRGASFAVATMLLISTGAPLMLALATEWRREYIAPELVRFDLRLDHELISTNSPTAIITHPVGGPVAKKALKITFADEQWPGVHIDEPIADWRPYEALAVDVFVEGSQPVPIHVSVRLDNAAVDQVYRTFECAPGFCPVKLPLAGLFDRDRARVNAVVIYSQRAFAGRTIYLGRVVLLKSP